MKPYRIVLLAFLGVLISSPADAQIFSTNLNWTTGYFNAADGYAPPGTSSLDGAPTNAPSSEQWKTTDPYNNGTGLGSTSLMSFVPGWTYGTSGSGNQSVYFGGYDLAGGIFPGIADPSLYREFTPFTGSPGVAPYATVWSVDFGIIDFGLTSVNNTFAFDLRTANNASSLAQFQFAYATNNLLDVQWYKDGVLQSSPFQIQYGGLYRLTATMFESGFDLAIGGFDAQTNNVGTVTNFLLVTNQTILSGAAYSGSFTRADFATTAMDWLLVSTNLGDLGSQSLIINQMSVNDVSTVVPEPATWAAGLSLLGIAAFIVWRRKASTPDTCGCA